MELCDVCGNEQEDGETYTCKDCGVSFCPDCGNTYQLICADCEDSTEEKPSAEEKK